MSARILLHHDARRHVGPESNLRIGARAFDVQLDVRAADVQHQDAPRRAPAGASLCALHRQILPGLARFGHGRERRGMQTFATLEPSNWAGDRPTPERRKIMRTRDVILTLCVLCHEHGLERPPPQTPSPR